MRYRSDIERVTDRRGGIRPRDGAIIDLVVDETNQVVWFFKYRKNTPGKYKWIAIGRQEPIFLQYTAQISPTPANTWVFGVSGLLIPFSGSYWNHLSAVGGSGVAINLLAGISVDAAAPSSGAGVGYTTVGLVAGENKPIEWEAQVPQELFAGHSLYPAFQSNVTGQGFSSNGSVKTHPRAINI